jgi:hypothetical protein
MSIPKSISKDVDFCRKLSRDGAEKSRDKQFQRSYHGVRSKSFSLSVSEVNAQLQ